MKKQFRRLSTWMTIAGVVGMLTLFALLPATASAATAQSTKCTVTDTQCVITAGNQLIQARLTALNTLNGKVTTDLSSHKITSSQASSLQGDISTNESGLNTLKSKLDAETMAKNARADVLAMYTQFRIYAVVIPRDSRNLLLDIEENAQQLMTNVAPSIQAAINAAPASEQSKLKALYSDYQTQTSNASSQFTTANQDIPQMTPQAFNQTRSTYEGVRASLDKATSTASKDLHQAAKDLKQIVSILGHDI
jgi:septal ring factor EnvC (AmiA/AmiB activator)